MTARVIVGNLRTGRSFIDIPFTTETWAQRRNAPDDISASVDLSDPDIAALGLKNVATFGKAYMAVLEGDVFMAGGPLGRPSYDRDTHVLSLTASGIETYFKDRSVLPLAALTAAASTFLIPDGVTPSKTVPNPALGTYLSALDMGSLYAAVITQSMLWPGGDLPLVVHAPRVGTRVENFEGIDVKNIYEYGTNLSARQNGPDIAWAKRWQTDRLGIEWVLRTGTETSPRLRSETVQRWDLSAEQTTTRGLKVSPVTAPFGSLGWQIGGRSDDTVIVERAYDTTLVDAGFPLREIVDSTHQDVKVRQTLQDYAMKTAVQGKKLPETWSFQVRKDTQPLPGDYGVGDRCQLIVKDDPYLPDSPPTGYLREIAGLSGDQDDWITVTTMEI